MNIDETNKRIYQLESIALHRDINDRGYDFMDVIDECLDLEETKEYDFLIKLRCQLEEAQEREQIWKRIEELEQQAITAYREHTEWGYFLEALCADSLEDYEELMKLYKMVNHETYWRN